jgi:hypothetical protein
MKMTKRYALKLALRDSTSPVPGGACSAVDHDRKVTERMIEEIGRPAAIEMLLGEADRAEAKANRLWARPCPDEEPDFDRIDTYDALTEAAKDWRALAAGLIAAE